MAEKNPWEEINAQFSRSAQAQILRNLGAQELATCRVFRLQDTGTCAVLRGIEEAPGRQCVYGPAAFAECLKWVNDHRSDKPPDPGQLSEGETEPAASEGSAG